MRKTDISRYGKSRADFKNDGARKGRCNNKKARALGLALRILWKAMLSLVVVIILTGILVVLSLNRQ